MPKRSAMKIWYHVDDLGATKNVTELILNAWEQDLINSVSIISNGDAIDDVCAGLSRLKEKALRISVHLNISEGKACRLVNEKAVISDDDGDLISGFGHILKMWTILGKKDRRALMKEVENEWDAQITNVKQMVYPRGVTALDGHIQVHMLPFLFPVALKLSKKHGIREIRITKERFFVSHNIKDLLKPEIPANIIKHLILNFFSLKNRRLAKKHGVGTPEWYVSILYTGIMTKAAVEAGIETVRRIKGKSVEVVFHIGRASDHERKRWKKNPDVGKFYFSRNRTDELQELIKLKENKG